MSHKLQQEEYFVRFPKSLPRFVVGILLLNCLVWLDCPLCLLSQAQSKDDDAIRALVGRLFELYQQKEINKLISLWSEKSSFLAENKKALEKDFTDYEKIVVRGFEVRKIQVDVDKA